MTVLTRSSIDRLSMLKVVFANSNNLCNVKIKNFFKHESIIYGDKKRQSNQIFNTKESQATGLKGTNK